MSTDSVPQLPYYVTANIVQGCTFLVGGPVTIGGADPIPPLTTATFRAELRTKSGTLIASTAATTIVAAATANAFSFTMSEAETAARITEAAGDIYYLSADMLYGGSRWPLFVLRLARIPQLITGA